jgi:hypothetical protein
VVGTVVGGAGGIVGAGVRHWQQAPHCGP